MEFLLSTFQGLPGRETQSYRDCLDHGQGGPGAAARQSVITAFQTRGCGAGGQATVNKRRGQRGGCVVRPSPSSLQRRCGGSTALGHS